LLEEEMDDMTNKPDEGIRPDAKDAAPASEPKAEAETPAADDAEAGSDTGRPIKDGAGAGRRRAGKGALQRQWRKGLSGDRVKVLFPSIPEDPSAFYAPDVLDGLDPPAWDAAGEPWRDAALALSATLVGRVLGASLGMAPDRHRWHAVISTPGQGAVFASPVAWRDPARCLLAARAHFAADVEEEAEVWEAVKRAGVDDETLRGFVSAAWEQVLAADERDPGEAPAG
jgi:hypothetical protein